MCKYTTVTLFNINKNLSTRIGKKGGFHFAHLDWTGCFSEGEGFCGAAVDKGGRGVIVYRGPVLASLWQKWGFHARLGANAVLLIWAASKDLEGAGSPPAPPPSSGPARKSPHLFGPLLTFERNHAGALRGRVSSTPPPQSSSAHSATLWASFWSSSMIKIAPSSSLHSYFHSSGMWIVDPSLSTPLSFLRSRVLVLKTEQRENVSLFSVFESYVDWQLCLKFLPQTIAAKVCCN